MPIANKGILFSLDSFISTSIHLDCLPERTSYKNYYYYYYCNTGKEGENNIQTLKKTAASIHNNIPFNFSEGETVESKKDTVNEVRKVKEDMEKSTEKKTEISHKILLKNSENSRGEGYILERDPGGSSSLGSRE